ncbi:patatin-like phospholipase family protein [Sphingomonas sp. PL-96]|uniref:patatin-like phospholipase family protein n=1 Tax=Sphingomonas sp. PL-96 TaxID=2887201 RepID=UPI001E4B4CEA|nr:patatin-like phospholipase family protein [Sphingomonas sp. PL-96]MCC2978286.1 patatin-like phospholipase family protein [Sphingomonas sp. PL-96]
MPLRTPYTATDLSSAMPLGEQQQVRFWSEDDDAAYDRWSASLLDQRRNAGLAMPRTLLALSGGSDKGAFSAGLLNGWSRRGDRPSFDVVTGVSTGALIAPFAFLGPQEDAALTAIYTGIGARDVYRQRVLRGLFGGSSLVDSRPLAKLIARYADVALVERVAAEHRKGRRLLVMTTNLDAQRGVIWDMGAIAAGTSPGRVALFQQVLLASASIPGVFPPVLIDATANGRHFAEMHVDGGAVSGFFVLPSRLLAQAPRDEAGRGAIYLFYNGRYTPAFKVVKPDTFGILSRGLATSLRYLDRGGVEEVRRFTRDHTSAFRLCSIEGDTLREDAPLFDTAHMRELYALGTSEAAAKPNCLTP